MGDLYIDIADGAALAAFAPVLWKMWGQDMPLDSYSLYLHEVETHPWMRGHVRTLVLRNAAGEFLAHLRLHAVRALHFDREVTMGGIAAVLTPEPLRGHGYASRLIELTLDLLKREGVDGAYLFSDIDPAFYERFGFRLLPSRMAEIPAPAHDAPRHGPLVRPAEEKDWKGIHEMHRSCGDGQPLWFLRNPIHWDYLLRRRFRFAAHANDTSIAPVESVVEAPDGRLLGYAISRMEEEGARLLEFGLVDQEPSLLDALLLDLHHRAAQTGRTRVTATWPPGSWGSMFHGKYPPRQRTESLFMVCSLSGTIDVDRLVREEEGFWESDHI